MAVHPASLFLEANWNNFPRDFWIAATATGVVTEERDIADVYRTLQRLKVNLDDVAVAYVTDGTIQ